jgi:hypothetical protein
LPHCDLATIAALLLHPAHIHPAGVDALGRLEPNCIPTGKCSPWRWAACQRTHTCALGTVLRTVLGTSGTCCLIPRPVAQLVHAWHHLHNPSCQPNADRASLTGLFANPLQSLATPLVLSALNRRLGTRRAGSSPRCHQPQAAARPQAAPQCHCAAGHCAAATDQTAIQHSKERACPGQAPPAGPAATVALNQPSRRAQ